MTVSKGKRTDAEKAWAAREESVSLRAGSSAVGHAEPGREAGGAQAMSTGADPSLTIFVTTQRLMVGVLANKLEMTLRSCSVAVQTT